MNQLLFLCTGNYYRSRFCEEYFNYLAQNQQLAWRADSRGLAPDITVFRNPGPISFQTHERLKALGVPLGESIRYPRSVQPDDWAKAHRVIALSRDEHQRMVEQFFPAFVSAVDYWEIGDLDIVSSMEALEAMTSAVQELVDSLC